MLAGQFSDFFTNVDLVHTDATFSGVFRSEHVFRNLLAWQRINVSLCGRWRGVVRSRLLHELRDDAIETFLRVHKVAHLTATRYEA
jgi:hypothetical protein